MGADSPKLAEYERQDAAVAIVIELDRRIDPAERLKAPLGAVCRDGVDGKQLSRRKAVGDASDLVGFFAAQAERLTTVADSELQRQHAHADQIRPVDALVGFREYGADAEHHRAFGGPVA